MKTQRGEMEVTIVLGVLGVVAAIVFGFWFFPVYNVWSSQKSGEATLARAESARMVLVTQAHAEREAAAQRAEAIKIVGQATKDFPEYRQQEFIGAFAEALKDGHIAQIIYVPTEAGIPILEANRHAGTK